MHFISFQTKSKKWNCLRGLPRESWRNVPDLSFSNSLFSVSRLLDLVSLFRQTSFASSILVSQSITELFEYRSMGSCCLAQSTDVCFHLQRSQVTIRWGRFLRVSSVHCPTHSYQVSRVGFISYLTHQVVFLLPFRFFIPSLLSTVAIILSI